MRDEYSVNLKIAQFLGHNLDHLLAQYEEWVTEDGKDGGEGFYCPKCGRSVNDYKTFGCVKNWSGNISKAFDLENSIPQEKIEEYVNLLIEEVFGEQSAFAVYPSCVEIDTYGKYNKKNYEAHEAVFAMVHATSMQRCVAWLRMNNVTVSDIKEK